MELEKKEVAYNLDLELISDDDADGEQIFGKNIVLPKLAKLDNSVMLCMSKLELFSTEMKVMLSQIEIISKWIHGKFGIDIFDRQSLSRHHHKNHNVGEIKKFAELLTTKVLPVNAPNSSINSNESNHGIEKAEPPLQCTSKSKPEPEFKLKVKLHTNERENVHEILLPNEKSPSQSESKSSKTTIPTTCTETDAVTEKTTSHMIAHADDDNKSESAETSMSAESETDVKDEVTSECEEFDLTNDRPNNDSGVHFTTEANPMTQLSLLPLNSKANSATHQASYQYSETKLVDPGPGQASADLVVYSKSNPKTNEKVVQVQCDECGKILKSSAGLKEHKKTHGNVRPFKCDTCGKAFLRRSKLEMHSRIHLGDAGKNLQCRFCGKLFMIPRDLGRHERTHTGDKPYSCPLCPKSFNVKQHVTLHIRTHTGDKPYLCTICKKNFTQANSLRIHKKIHEGKPYVPPSVLRKAEEKKSNKKKSKPVLKA